MRFPTGRWAVGKQPVSTLQGPALRATQTWAELSHRFHSHMRVCHILISLMRILLQSATLRLSTAHRIRLHLVAMRKRLYGDDLRGS